MAALASLHSELAFRGVSICKRRELANLVSDVKMVCSVGPTSSYESVSVLMDCANFTLSPSYHRPPASEGAGTICTSSFIRSIHDNMKSQDIEFFHNYPMGGGAHTEYILPQYSAVFKETLRATNYLVSRSLVAETRQSLKRLESMSAYSQSLCPLPQLAPVR
jgi:hypothetical protein